MRLSHAYSVLLALSFGLCCAAPATAHLRMEGPTDQSQVMHLGEIEVHGQENITRTLQAIKVALTRPYSNDPKLANVMVCRLEDQAGSHIKQDLVCGTNRILSLRRSSLQSSYTAAAAANAHSGRDGVGCFDSICYTSVFEQLNQTISTLPGNYLDQAVNGPALRKALQSTPMPAPDAAPAVAVPAVLNAAPAAATGPHTL